LLERVEIEFSSQPASVHGGEIGTHVLGPCQLLPVIRLGVHLSPPAVEKPDIVFRMLEMILCGDPISGPGGLLGKPFIAGDGLLEIASGTLLGAGTVRLVSGALAIEAV
jgi:hypothetical protein